MSNTRRIKGIGDIDEWGEIINGVPYEGQKGFKVVNNRNHKIIYSLEKQKKLFSVPKNMPIELNERVVIIPIEPIKYLFFNNEEFEMYKSENLLGVFNCDGDIITFATKVKLYKDFFQVTVRNSCDKWGLYTYDGEEIFAKEYYFIECIEFDLSGNKQMVFHVASSELGTRALFRYDKKVLIPWGFQEIKVDTPNNRVIVLNQEEKKIYPVFLDDEGKLFLVK